MDHDQKNNAEDSADATPKRRSTDAVVNEGLTKRDGTPRAKPPAKNPNMNRRGRPAHGPEAKAIAERQAEALKYRRGGASYEQIAKALEFGSTQSAWNAVNTALLRIIKEPATEVLKLELERLDELFIKPYAAAKNGDLQSLNAVMTIMTRRAKLLGLDAPERKELTGADGKDLVVTPTTIIIGGDKEPGEPDVMGESVVESSQ